MDAQFEAWRGTVPPIAELVRRLQALPLDVQLLRGDRVLGTDHLRAAVLHADRAFREGRNVASTWPLEVLRYAAGERQIGRALRFLGLEPGPALVVAVVRGDEAPFHALARELGWERAPLPEPDEARLAAWDFPPAARALLPPERRADLVLERVALADLG